MWRAGMTLVEILVAISVSALVLLAAASVYRVITGSIRHQQRNRQLVVYSALEQFRQDLSQSAPLPSTNLPAFMLESRSVGTNVPALSSLAVSIGSLSPREVDFSGMEFSRIRYYLILQESGGTGRLIRETMSLWGSNALAPAVSNAILEHVTVFEMSVLSGSEWTNNWVSSGRTLLPRAARLRLDWMTEGSRETANLEVFIPAGNLVPSGKSGH